MTAKQYANELYNRFYAIIFERGEEMSEEIVISLLAKECAKQAVKEILAILIIPVFLENYFMEVMEELDKL